MKSKFKFLAALFFILTNSVLIFGQEKTLDKKVFEDIIIGANSKLSKTAYRSIKTFEFFSDVNSPPKNIKKITEISIPPDKFHSIYETEGEKKELIIIGSKRYIRENGGEWKNDDRSGIGSGMGCGAGTKSETFKVVENIKLDRKTVKLYETKKEMYDVSCGDDGGKNEIWTERYWISEDGLLMKTEELTEIVGENSLKKNAAIYEYDSKIKIEAPIK